MARPYYRLRQLMLSREVTLEDLGRVLLVTRQQVSNKLCNKSQWKLAEMWAVMNYMGISPADMARYFPDHGRNE